MLRLSTQSYRIPFRMPLHTAHGRWSEREGVLVRLEDRDGRVGYGEAAPVPGFAGATQGEIESAVRTMGCDVDERLLERVIAEGGALGFALTSAWAALDETRGLQAPRAHDFLPVAGLLPAGKAAFRVAVDRAELGFRTFKWKVGVVDPRDERGMLDDLLSTLPRESRLRLDANGAWNRRQAEAWLDCCAERPMIDFVEQPVATDGERGIDLLRGLAEDYPTTLALDEALTRSEDLHTWLDVGWSGVWVMKPALMGDPEVLRATIEHHKLDVVISTALETAIGARDAYALAFALSSKKRALGMGVWPLFPGNWANGPMAMPFVHWSDVENLDAEAVWNGASS